MSHPFNARQYWESRLKSNFNPSGVGWERLGSQFNRWAYAAKKVIFSRTLKNLGLAPRGYRVMDIGSGTGFYIDRWLEAGATDIAGCDITQTAVEMLTRKYPSLSFRQVDIGSPMQGTEDAVERFDAISCFDVLYHIVEDEAFARSIENISTMLRKGGHLFLTDYFFFNRPFRSRHVAGRTFAEYRDLLEKNGLEIVLRRPASVLFFPPYDHRLAVLEWAWMAATLPVRLFRPLGFLYGLLIYPLDVALTAILKETPGLEIMVCRKGTM